VLSRHIVEPIHSVVECQVDVVVSWEADKCRECLFVLEVCVLPTLREFLPPRLLWNVAHLCSSSGRGVELLELVVTGRVAYMLPQAILVPDGLAARTFYPVAAFDCINSWVEGRVALVLL
jgi:hypothetical protein